MGEGVRVCCRGIKCRGVWCMWDKMSYFEEDGQGLANTTILSSNDGDLSLLYSRYQGQNIN